MATVSTSFTSSTQSDTLSVEAANETITITLLGTYSGIAELQKSVGSGEDAWETVATYTTDNDTVSADFNSGGAKTRWRIEYTYTSGTCVTTVADGDLTISAGEGTIRTQAGVTELAALTVDGEFTMNATATVPSGATLVVESGGTITNNGTATGFLGSTLSDNSVTLAKMAGGTDGNLISFDTAGDPAYVATGTSGHVLTSGGVGVAPTFAANGGVDDDGVTLAKMAHGTDGNLITYDAAGAPAHVTTGTSGQVLTSGGVGVAPTFADAATGSLDNIVEDLTPQLGGDLDLNGNVITGLVLSTGTNTGDEAVASLTVSGTVEIATVAETNIGTDATRAVSPAGLTGWTGDTGVVTVGTIGTGTWQGTAVAEAYIADNSITLAKMASGTDGNIISYDASGNPVAIATGSDGQVLTSTGAGSPPAFETAAAGGGSSDYVHISTQTVSSDTAQVEFDLSSSDYGSFFIFAHDCTFTAAPTNEYCLYFVFYEGAYDSAAPATNRMSLKYQRGAESASSIATSVSWAYNTTMLSGSTPTTSTKFGFSGMIGGRTNSPVDLNGYFVTGTSDAGAPRIRGIAPNTSNNMTYMLIKPSTTTFATGKFALYGLKDA